MSIGKKITKIREQQNMKMTELAKKAQISVSYLNDIEKGRTNPSIDTLKAIAIALNSTPGYLLDEQEDSLISINNTKIIPILGVIRAGLPLLAEENWEEEIEVPPNLHADFALRVIGDSMSWAGIHEGDIAILQKIDIPSHGMIVAAGIEDATWEATLKFYVKENGKPILRAANPAYEDIVITPAHRIIGQVVSVQKEPPTLQTYKDILIPREIMDEQWQKAIEKATQYGLDGEKVEKLIELFAHMAKNF
ncbi:MAG: repressor LexA [Clostridia bacterium]|nr:repressor LexA [Clostridia bacterium]